MAKPQKLLTREDIKADFKARGITTKSWAKQNGFAPATVSAVLNGFLKGHRGEAHAVAVALGMKADPKLRERDAA